MSRSIPREVLKNTAKIKKDIEKLYLPGHARLQDIAAKYGCSLSQVQCLLDRVVNEILENHRKKFRA